MVHWLLKLNNKYVSGEPRRLDKEKDVILVTGASSGLGRKICAAYAIDGFQVAALDIVPPEFDLPGINYFKCDVSSLKEVQQVQKQVVQKFGKVTVLINNAGIVEGETIADSSPEMIEKVINVNLMSHFWTIKTFLPDMLEMKRGYIVTVSSVLGYIGPAKCASYSSAKAGLLTMHDSLAHELKGSGVKTLLVTTGQMNSRLFGKIQKLNQFVAPVLTTAEVALVVVAAVAEGKCGQIAMPTYAHILPLARAILPQGIMDFLRSVFNVDGAMNGYGKQEKSSKDAIKRN